MTKYDSEWIEYLLEDFVDFLDKSYNQNKMHHNEYSEAMNLIEQFKYDFKKNEHEDIESNRGIDEAKNNS